MSSHKKRRGTIDDILRWTRTGLSWGQKVATVVPIPAYGPISQVLIQLIDQIAAARTNKQAAEDVLQHIQVLATIVGSSKEELENRITPLSSADKQTVKSGFLESSLSQDPFDQFYRDLKRLAALSEGLKHPRYLPRWFFNSKDAEIIQEIEIGVSKAQTYFQTRCQVVVQGYLETIDNRLGRLHSAVDRVIVSVDDAAVARKAEDDNKVLETLPHADAGYRASTNELKSGFLEGTRSGLFAELEKWVGGELPNKSICVLSGGAGTGKSTVASELAKRLDTRYGKLGASFFFARGVTDLDTTRVFFPTIAYQLAHSQWTKGTLRQPIIDAARVHLAQGRTQAMEYEAPALLHGPLEFADKKTPIFVVVDALDECTQEAFKLVPEMLRLLMASTDHGPLRIFLTFRPDQLVEYNLQSSQWSNIIHTISIDTFSDDSSRDVAVFIKVRLNKIAHGPDLLRRRPEVADSLAARAQGLFIYARTAMDFLETYPGTLDEGVDVLLSGEEGVALGALDQLYLTVLANAFPPEHLQVLALRARVQSVLACIALLRHPMTPRVLESLTSLTRHPITCGDTDEVLDRLRSVVVFKRDAPDEVFRPMHATFPQFLVDDARCTNDLYLVQPRRQHARLAEACLRALLSLERNMCKLDDAALVASVGDVADLQDRLAEHVPQHVQYACVHWAAHLREACRPGEHPAGKGCFCGNLVELLRSVVSPEKMLRWMETLAFMGRVDGALDALAEARNWLPADARFNALRASTDQGRQILFNHTNDIRDCPHSVYYASVQPAGSSRSSQPLVPLDDYTDMRGNRIVFNHH
ncbi:hypothetical protein GSI_08419 [Ganoderma sinense ZZ0214-1]|uniref:Nephrocystin 3-like N-terminal domain-containing protein n=1 Tax=Ganoderma sinense ZZ0214-1 TaxID=1077348 RepID=A0A2G8S6X3_9APHY|nr:hypothetical protein GSI_08419 [Ganoderma sinense ZZ0214-1]